MRELSAARALAEVRGAARIAVALVLVACALVVAAAWWVGRASPDAPTHVEHVAAESRPATRASEPPIAAAEPAERARVVEPEPQAARPLDRIPADHPAARERIEVLVVEMFRARPVADAVVSWANLSEYGAPLDAARPRWLPDTEEMLAGARTTKTDAQGRAWIDARVFPGRLFARSGRTSGDAQVDERTPRPLRVELVYDFDVVIAVVDSAGRPVAGVPVGLRASSMPSTREPAWRGTTAGVGGTVAVRRLPGMASSPTLYAFLDIPMFATHGVAVDLTRSIAERVELTLVLPPCGSVTIEAHDASGARVVPDDFTLAIDAQQLLQRDSWSLEGFEPERVENGVATYLFVALDLELRVWAMRAKRTGGAQGPGPVSPGERVHFVVDVGKPCVFVTGRLVDEANAPLSRRWVKFTATPNGAGQDSASRLVQTDENGRFRETLPIDVGARLAMTLRWDPTGIGAGERARAEVALDVPEAPAVVDLGDVRARGPTPLASGIVVDDLGQPVPNPVIAVETCRGGDTWRNDPECRTLGRYDGTFTITCPTVPDRMRIRALRQGFAQAAPLEVAIGTRDVRVELARASSVAGTVLLDSAIAPKRIEVHLARGVPVLTWDREQTRIRDDGTFRFEGLLPGRVDVEIRASGQAAVLRTIAGVDLPAGGVAADARLESIDVRGRVTPIAGDPGGPPPR